ncbi:MAG: DUF4340 domain-containing protein, partial [Ruminococcus sp.]|nr:DUF4340 domain-containing protein [Ruminococcus sp.]
MKKVIIAIVVLAVTAGISISAFIGVKSKSEKETKKQEESLADNVLFNLDSETLTKIDVKSPDISYTAELSADKWVMDSSSNDTFELNQTTLQGICTYFAQLTADTNYGEATDENKTKYGLIEPYTVTVSDGTNEYTLHIGDKSPTGDYYYAYTDTKNNIYAIPASDAESILTTRLSIKDDNFIPYKDNEVVGMTLKKNGEIVYDLTYNSENGCWELPEEYAMLTVNQTRPATMVTLITRLTAEQMLAESDDDITNYGFDKPEAEFIVKGSDGSEKTILMSYYGKDAKTYTHVYMTDSKQVETYYTEDMKFINYEIFDFVMQTIENANLYSIKDFEINCNELSDKFTVDATNSYAECRGTEINLNTAEIKSFFTTFYNTFS